MDGAALGNGTEIALACELIIAENGAIFWLPEVKRSLVPGAGGAFRLPRSVPHAIANEIILTGAPISLQRAYEIGPVNHVVPNGEIVESAIEMAAVIASNSPLAVQEALRRLKQVGKVSNEELARHTVRRIGRLMHSGDFRGGVSAFIEKRAPSWKDR